MSEVWVSYFLFFAKVATVVLGILVVAIGLALIAKKKRIPSGTIELKNLGDHFQKIPTIFKHIYSTNAYFLWLRICLITFNFDIHKIIITEVGTFA